VLEKPCILHEIEHRILGYFEYRNEIKKRKRLHGSMLKNGLESGHNLKLMNRLKSSRFSGSPEALIY